MSTLTTIQSSDVIANSRADINGNFTALNNEKLETSLLTTDNTLSANSDLLIPSQKAVKAYVDAGGNVNASETTKGIVEEATDAEVTAGTATGGTGAKLFVSPAKLATRLSANVGFGGSGADGALSISSGTTTIDLANAAVVIKNYTSISITGTGKLAFSNPNTNGTLIVLKSQGAVTITSSGSPAIDVSGLGGAGGAVNTAGSKGRSNVMFATGSGGTGTAGGGGGGGAAGVAIALGGFLSFVDSPALFCGSGGGGGHTDANAGSPDGPGGGGGASATASGATGTAGTNGSAPNGAGGAGGKGGGALYIECFGAWNITGTIDASGKNGSNASGTGDNGGGGGGGGGTIVVAYNTLTADSGTYTVAAGSGGNATGNGGAGGAGGAGQSIVSKVNG